MATIAASAAFNSSFNLLPRISKPAQLRTSSSLRRAFSNQVSVRAALDEMQARAFDSSPVIDQRGELFGILSKNKMNRNVGGFGHDPKTEPVEAHIEKNNAYCFEDQTIAEAEQMMLNAKLGEVFVVTREKLLVGTINIEAIAQEGKKLGSRLHLTSSPI